MAETPAALRSRQHQSGSRTRRSSGEIILEAGDFPDGNGSMPRRRSADGANPARLRGLPAIGRNVTGATIHTDPGERRCSPRRLAANCVSEGERPR